jgi:hypothetical protein
MASTGNRKNVDELDAALRLLDHELDGLKLEAPLRVRAIGGYALLKYGVRSEERALTVDIDSVTKKYSAAVEAAIATVGEKAGLDHDWLNNYGVMDNDPDTVEEMIDAKWTPQAMDLRNIAVDLATIETLTRSKIIAVDTAQESGRTQDEPDLVSLLEHQGITSMRQFSTKYPDPYGEYAQASRVVAGHFGGSAARAAAAREVLERFPELADDTDSDVDYDSSDEDSWDY